MGVRHAELLNFGMGHIEGRVRLRRRRPDAVQHCRYFSGWRVDVRVYLRDFRGGIWRCARAESRGLDVAVRSGLYWHQLDLDAHHVCKLNAALAFRECEPGTKAPQHPATAFRLRQAAQTLILSRLNSTPKTLCTKS